jgi:hypothetical protein
MIEKYSKIDETFNVTRCDNGFMIEFSGRDGNDDYVNSKLIFSTVDELFSLIKQLINLPKC